MNEITLLREAGPQAPTLSSDARARARAALLDEVAASRPGSSRTSRHFSSRRTGRRGAAVVAVAAAACTTFVVVGPDALPPRGVVGAPALDVDLVAAETPTFPLSLDPVPVGLAPAFTGGGLSPVATADYRSAEGGEFALSVSTQDPCEIEGFEDPQDSYAKHDITETGTVEVAGSEADFVRGDYDQPSCTYAPSTPVQTETPAEVCHRSFAHLFWQRSEGQWVWVSGADTDADALIAVAESVVDRPQPVALQLGLAPAGWSTSSYTDTGLTITDDDSDQQVSISVLEAWRGYTADNLLDGVITGAPADWELQDERREQVSVGGLPAQLVHVPEDEQYAWHLGGQIADGPLFLLQAPGSFTREQVLEMASEVTYSS